MLAAGAPAVPETPLWSLSPSKPPPGAPSFFGSQPINLRKPYIPLMTVKAPPTQPTIGATKRALSATPTGTGVALGGGDGGVETAPEHTCAGREGLP